MVRLEEKDRSIQSVVERLRQDLGDDAFDIVDHWEIDLCAIGLAAPNDHQVLAYISTYGHPEGQYSYELEVPPEPNTDDVYAVASRNHECDYTALLAALKEHWKS